MSNPQQATQFKNNGNQAFKAQRYEQAIQLFTKAIQCNPNDHVFFSNRSGSYLNNGDHEKALQDAETCVKMNPNWPRGYQRKGTALFYLDKVDQAIQVYKDGLVIDPTNADLQKDLKAAQNKKKEASGAPKFDAAYMQALIKLMGHPETKDFFNDPSFMQKIQAIMANPQLASFYMQQDPKLQKVFQVLNNTSTPQEKSEFEKMYKQSEAFQPKQQQPKKSEYSAPPPPKRKQEKKPEKMQAEDPAEDMKNQGNDEFKKKNFNQALNLYESAIQLNPNEPLYYNNKAAAYIELKEYENALEEVNKGLKLFDQGVAKDFIKKAKVLARKGTIYAKLQKYTEAIEALQKSLLQDSNSKVKDELQKLKKVKKDREAKEYINPEVAEKHNEQGAELYKQGKFPQALKEYEQAVRRNPEVAKYYSNIGQVYIKLIEFQRAKENYQLALKKDPKFLKAYHKKGDCHFFMKEYHKALETYEQGLKIDPNDNFCKEGLTKTQNAIYMSNSQEDQEERARKAMADPEIQAILHTPEIRNALADLQRDPKSLPNILKNKSIAEKLQKLIAAGVLRVG